VRSTLLRYSFVVHLDRVSPTVGIRNQGVRNGRKSTQSSAKSLTGLGNTKIYDLISAGKLKSITVGRRRLIVYASIEELVKTNREAA
jgi:excisionase family DNA binding protein